jgi:hypothetical protein
MTSAVHLLKFCPDWAVLRMMIARDLFECGPRPTSEFDCLASQVFNQQDLLRAAESLSLESFTVDGREYWRLPSKVVPFLAYPSDDDDGGVPCGVAA